MKTTRRLFSNSTLFINNSLEGESIESYLEDREDNY